MEHIIELPEKFGSYKVVQIYLERDNQKIPFLPFNHMGQYHADILGDFLKANNIAFGINNEHGKELPSLKGNGYEVVGMGYIDTYGKMIMFSRDSFDYGLGINREHIEKCKSHFRNKDLKVIIE